MKKIFYMLVVLLALTGYKASAQYGNALTLPLIAGDTLNNVDTVTKLIRITGGFSGLGVQVNLNKISGTVAGKAYLWQSLDGSNYLLTDSASYTTLSTTQPSLATPTVTASAIFQKALVPSTYYLVEAVSSGTVSMQVKVLYTTRKYATSTNIQ